MTGSLKLAVAFAVLGVSGCFSASVPEANEGRIESCDSTKLNLTAKWTPRVVSIGTTYHSSLVAVTANTFDHGRICGRVWLKDIPDPVYDDCSEITCDDVITFAKKYIPYLQLSCPIPKGVLVNIPSHEFYIDPLTPLPGGIFKARLELTNENKEEFACIQSTIEVSDDFDYNF